MDLAVETSSPQQTQLLASAISELLAVGDLLVLTGDLGAGKTCFTQGLGRGLGITERITSPTFTLAGQYQGRLLLHHLDAYRLDTIGEALDLDLPDLLESGVTVIEWGELLTPVLPEDHLLVAIEYHSIEPTDGGHPRSDEVRFSDDHRVIRFVGHGELWADRWPEVQRKLRSVSPSEEATK